MQNKKKYAVATGIVAATLALGGAGIAMATSDSEDTAVTGTVEAPPEETAADGTEVETTDAEEDATLRDLATVTPDEAEAAALAAVPGTIREVDLDDEDGFVVYEVEVTAADGTVTGVLIDAGDASVLAQEAEDADDDGDDADDDADDDDTEDTD
ncbi:PepSY domain-containing protein [Agrococcus sp. Ld7]|uniref:PepSY domain-containing protein n=1 Tax=Agrococcus sp. Ld7 TaxID=649148 RepID=UPI003864F04A